MGHNRRNRIGYGLMVMISIGLVLVLGLQPPLAQDPAYHMFADQGRCWFIPNCWNVLSSLAFIIVGMVGVFRLTVNRNLQILHELKLAYLLLFLGLVLVGFGSGYYHYSPANQSLLWDRLPMTMVFMALFSIIVGEFISVAVAKFLLWPAVLAGLVSVLYWYAGEAGGEGDLRLYVLVQFLPILLTPVILFCFDSRFSGVSAYWWLLILYLIAKIFEYFDAEVYELLVFISGHTIKHLLAALAIFILLKSYQGRKTI